MNRTASLLSLGIVVLLLVLLVVGLKPYLSAILGALIFGPVFRPVYRWIRDRIHRPSLAAAATLVLILLVVVVPLAGVATLALREAQAIATQYQDLRPGALDAEIYGRSVADLLTEGARVLVSRVQDSLGDLFSGTVRAVIGAFIMFYLIYYILVEEGALQRVIRELVPFRDENFDQLAEQIGRISRGFIFGQGVTALIQGALGGIGFLIFGFPGAFLWAIVMAALSLIPVLGAFLIWVPAGLLQIATGATGSGIGILVWGAVVVSMADNLIRPMLMKRTAGVHPVITLLGVFAGLSLFGMIGIVAGPLLFSLSLETARMFYREQAERA